MRLILQCQRLLQFLHERRYLFSLKESDYLESLSVQINGKNIIDFTEMSITQASDFINNLTLSPLEAQISRLIVKEIKNDYNS